MNSGLITIQWRLHRIGFPTDSAASFTALSGPYLYTWIHVVGTYDGEALRMFINGVPVPDDSGFVAVSVGVCYCVCV